MMGPDGSGGGVHQPMTTAVAGADAVSTAALLSSSPPCSSLLRKLSVGHERALLAQWDAEEQSTLDAVLAKLPFAKHSALER